MEHSKDILDAMGETIDVLRGTVRRRDDEILELKAEIARLVRRLKDKAEDEKQVNMFGGLSGIPN